jgi:hypothetical protein
MLSEHGLHDSKNTIRIREKDRRAGKINGFHGKWDPTNTRPIPKTFASASDDGRGNLHSSPF